ncbi:MAG: mechanosensitive ion channel family protein [Cyanobacteria bacterium J06636_16]
MACLWLMVGSRAMAQLGESILDFSRPTLTQSVGDTGEATDIGCVYLDGHCTFRVAAPRSNLSDRIQTIQKALAEIRAADAQAPDDSEPALNYEILEVTVSSNDTSETSESESSTDTVLKSPSIFLLNSSEKSIRLMNVTRFDAELKGVDAETAAQEYIQQVAAALRRSRRENSLSNLTAQAGLSIVVILLLLGVNWGIFYRELQLQGTKSRLRDSLRERSQPLQSFLNERRYWNITEAQLRFFQLTRAGLWIGGLLFILSRFPMTRIIKVRIVEGLRTPIHLLVISLLIYLAVRLSFALINRLTGVLASSYEITPKLNRRTQLRVDTISRVSRGVVLLAWLGVGLLLALTAVGLNIAPLLAGAGIIGLALSLPAQSLIKDAINGFFIIVEDQYAVGDVITVHGIRGLVENINLRITQMRDEEGRLVTIPNSEIGVIANHSSHWSQADIHIPISYHADVDKVLELISKTGIDMKASDRWQEDMLIEPHVLGVEDFGERGLTIRVWIKTQPLKQWDVAREYRRRLKVALDAEGIVIPAHIDFKSPSDGEGRAESG